MSLTIRWISRCGVLWLLFAALPADAKCWAKAFVPLPDRKIFMQAALVVRRFLGYGWLAMVGLLLAQGAFAKDSVSVSLTKVSPHPAMLGQSVAFAANLTYSCDDIFECYKPTGSIGITEGGTTVCSGMLNTSAYPYTMSCSASFSVAGYHDLKAYYPGDSHFYSSTSTPDELAVQTDSAISVTSNLNPTFYRHPPTFTAQVHPVSGSSSASPTGKVVFKANGSEIGSALLNSSGTANYKLPVPFPVGSLTITAEYVGDSIFFASEGALSGNPQLIMPNTLTVIASSANPSNFGQMVTFTATVSSVFQNDGIPTTGSVTFRDGNTVIQYVPIDGTGTAERAVSTLAIGSHTISATYNGSTTDGSFWPSTDSLTQEVKHTKCDVKVDASGSNSGDSWPDAYHDLQSALRDPGCSEIWVAKGVYKPTATTDRSISFDIRSNVAIYGGFVGNETARDQRSPTVNLTVLSGDIDGNDVDDDGNQISETADETKGNNSYHVVTIDEVGADVYMDGLVVTAGRASGGDSVATGHGSGLYVLSGNVVLHDLRVVGNRAYRGGGLYLDSTSPDLDGLEISGNLARTGGGGLYCNGENGGTSSPALSNVTFSGNSSDQDGGAMYDDGQQGTSSPTLRNVTFSGNEAGDGGAMYNDGLGGVSSPTLSNVILWGDTATGLHPEIYNTFATPKIDRSVVQGSGGSGIWDTTLGADDGGNLDADPLLVSLANNGGFTQTMLPGSGSSAIDAGTCPDTAVTDQRGIARPQGKTCDIGAVEYSAIDDIIFAYGFEGPSMP